MNPCFEEAERPTALDIKNHIIIGGYDVSIDEEHLNQIEKNYSLEEYKEELLAKGIQPKEGERESIVYYVSNPEEDHSFDVDEYDRVDYKSGKKIITLQEGDKILKVSSEISGEPGKDIFGKILEPKTLDKHGFRFGKNTFYNEESNILYSQVNGYLKIENNTLAVEEVFIIQGDVDMNIGHISSSTPILIMNDVKPGFFIQSEKDIIVKGNVEGGSLTSVFGKISIEGGIHGQSKSIIKAKNEISAKFVSNAILSCENDIVILDSIIQTTISCGKNLSIISNDHGNLIGGTTRISNSINLKNIGSTSEPKTLIFMGYNFKFEKMIHSIDVQLKELEREKENLQNIKIISPTSNLKFKTSLHEFYLDEAEIDQLIDRKKMELMRIEEEALVNHISSLKASGTIHPNTLLKMGNKSFSFSKEFCNIEVLFTPDTDSIEVIEKDGEKK